MKRLVRLAVLNWLIALHRTAIRWKLVEGAEKMELSVELRRLEALYLAVKYG